MSMRFHSKHFYHPEFCRDAGTGCGTDLCIWCRWSRSRSSLRRSHNRSAKTKNKKNPKRIVQYMLPDRDILMEKRWVFCFVFVFLHVCVSVCEGDYEKNQLQTRRAFFEGERQTSPPSSWDPSSDAPASNRSRLRSSSWGRAATRSSAAALWRWWRCGRSAGRPRPCGGWTGSQSVLHRGPILRATLCRHSAFFFFFPSSLTSIRQNGTSATDTEHLVDLVQDFGCLPCTFLLKHTSFYSSTSHDNISTCYLAIRRSQLTRCLEWQRHQKD